MLRIVIVARRGASPGDDPEASGELFDIVNRKTRSARRAGGTPERIA
jgi:hypothetical protein